MVDGHEDKMVTWTRHYLFGYLIVDRTALTVIKNGKEASWQK